MTGTIMKKRFTLGLILAIGFVGLSAGCQSKEPSTTTETTTTQEAPAPSGTPQTTTSTTTTTVDTVAPTPSSK
jgi:PBP1b-binding outer membrane lipoprotein LpoB